MRVVLLSMVFLCAGCGLKDDLYLPAPDERAQPQDVGSDDADEPTTNRED